MSFQASTKIFFGTDAVLRNRTALASLGKRFLIVTGKSSSQNGSLDDVKGALSGKEVEVFADVVENPPIELVERVVSEFKTFAPDVIVGLGGGSAMDVAKSVAVLLENDGLVAKDLYSPLKYSRAKSIVCVPTTAGTGSEVTPFAVLTIGGKKKGFAHEVIVPKVAFVDPKYTLTLPTEVTISTGLDALAHSIESYLSVRSDPFTEVLSLQAIRLAKESLPMVIKNGTDIRWREKLSMAATLSGMLISQTGTTIAHAMGNPLTTEKGLRHGIAAFLPLPFCLKHYDSRKVHEIELLFHEGLLRFVESIDVSVKLEVSDEEIERWASELSKDFHLKNTPGTFTFETIASVYREMRSVLSSAR